MNGNNQLGVAAGSGGAEAVRCPWQVPELLAAGAATASIGVFLGFLAAGIDVAIRVRGTQAGGADAHIATAWVLDAAPLSLLAVLAAWWGECRRPATGPSAAAVATRRRRRSPVLAMAILGLVMMAAGVTALIYTMVISFPFTPPVIATLARSVGLCLVALAVGFTLCAAARRLLRQGGPRPRAQPSPPSPDVHLSV